MKIGFAVCDITPPLGIYLTGYGMPERLADSVHSPLQANIMVMAENEREAAVIAFDWCFADIRIVDALRRGISDLSGIPEPHIIISCTHTHSAPHTSYGRTIGRVTIDPENRGVSYVFDILPKVAAAVAEAKKNMRCCKAAFGHTLTEAGVSRRGTDENGAVAGFIADPFRTYDSNMTVVRFRDAGSSEDLGIFVHASAHNTAMGHDRAISSDWCGVMREKIGAVYGVPVIFVNGAVGDAGPRTGWWREFRPGLKGFSAGPGDGPGSAAEVGEAAAADALRVLADMQEYREDLPLKIHLGELRLPRRLALSREEAEEIIRRYEADPAAEKRPSETADYDVALAVRAAWEKGEERELVLEQNIVAFGPLAIVPFTFEVFSSFSLRLRKYGPFEYNLLISNTNGRNAYLPDRGAFAEGGYEVTSLPRVAIHVVKPEAGDIAIAQSLASLRQMI